MNDSTKYIPELDAVLLLERVFILEPYGHELLHVDLAHWQEVIVHY